MPPIPYFPISSTFSYCDYCKLKIIESLNETLYTPSRQGNICNTLNHGHLCRTHIVVLPNLSWYSDKTQMWKLSNDSRRYLLKIIKSD